MNNIRFIVKIPASVVSTVDLLVSITALITAVDASCFQSLRYSILLNTGRNLMTTNYDTVYLGTKKKDN